MTKNKLFRTVIFILIIPLLAEVFFFNFRFWESLFFKDANGYFVTRHENEIILKDINAPVKNIYVDCSRCNVESKVINLQLEISDEANTGLMLSPTEVIPELMESNYLRIYPDGTVRDIKIIFDAEVIPDTSDIEITLNAKRPFCVHPIRMLVIALLLALFFIFRPGSEIYNLQLCGIDKKQTDRNKIYILVASGMVICLWVFIVCTFTRDIYVYYYNGLVEGIYTYQAEALLDGHAYLNIEPPKYLSEMSNPYDYNAKLELVDQTGQFFKLDFAFFNGKYYCYYGIVPTILMYLPYYAATSMPLSNSVPVLLFGIMFIAAAFMLIYKLVKRYYSDISLGVYLLLCLVFVFGSGAFYCAQTPQIYSVAFMTAMAFTLIAIYNWIAASDKHFYDKEAPLSKIRLFISAVSMGLAIGCRPVFGLYLFLIFPVFWSEIKEKLFFSKKGLGNTLCVIVPLLLIGSALLYFNKIRFGSIFDFGFTYNLSESDVSHRSSGIRKIWLGLFEYLFQPFKINGSFPYFESVFDYHNRVTDYLGYQFFDPVYCGYFALCPVCMAVFFLRKCRNTLKDMKMYSFCILSLIFTGVLLVFNIEKGGITMRYQLDFGMLLSFVAVFVLMALFKMSEKSSYKKAFKYILLAVIILTGVTIFNNLWIMLAESKQRSLATTNPQMFYAIKYLFFSLR